jgi:hypothetical protein
VLYVIFSAAMRCHNNAVRLPSRRARTSSSSGSRRIPNASGTPAKVSEYDCRRNSMFTRFCSATKNATAIATAVTGRDMSWLPAERAETSPTADAMLMRAKLSSSVRVRALRPVRVANTGSPRICGPTRRRPPRRVPARVAPPR